MVDAQPAQLGPDRLDVRLGRDPRVLAGLDGVLLGGQAEGVVAHGVQDVVPVHAQEPAGDVGAQVAQRVPDVQPGARGVREHVHHERLGPVGDALEALAERADRVGRVERPLGLPAVLPGQLDLLRQRGRVPVRRDAVGRRVGARLAGRLAHGRCSRVIWCARTGGGQKKTPHAWRGRRAVRTVSGQHGRRSRSRPVTGPSLPRRRRGTAHQPDTHPSPFRGESRRARVESDRSATDEDRVEQDRPVQRPARVVVASPWPCTSPSPPCSRSRPAWSSARPATAWDRLYDVVLFNAAYLLAAAASAGSRRDASGRSASPGGPSPSACCSAPWPTALRTLAAGIDGNGPVPPG